jgi:hypothetical protein
MRATAHRWSFCLFLWLRTGRVRVGGCDDTVFPALQCLVVLFVVNLHPNSVSQKETFTAIDHAYLPLETG